MTSMGDYKYKHQRYLNHTLSLENEIDGQTFIKTPVNYLTRIKVFSMIETFFNEMGISEYESKR